MQEKVIEKLKEIKQQVKNIEAPSIRDTEQMAGRVKIFAAKIFNNKYDKIVNDISFMPGSWIAGTDLTPYRKQGMERLCDVIDTIIEDINFDNDATK